MPPQHLDTVAAARDEVGDVCGSEPETSLERMARALTLDHGLCAVRLDDAVFVQRTDDEHLWEEYHAVSYLTGCWTIQERMYRGVWHHDE